MSTDTSPFLRALLEVDRDDRIGWGRGGHDTLTRTRAPWLVGNPGDSPPVRVKVKRFPEEPEDEIFVRMPWAERARPPSTPSTGPVLQELHGRVTALDDDGFDTLMVDERGRDWLRRFEHDDVAPEQRDLVREGAAFVWRELRPLLAPWRHRWELHFLPPLKIDDGLDDEAVVTSILGAIETDAD